MMLGIPVNLEVLLLQFQLKDAVDKIGDGVGPGVGMGLDDVDDVFREGVDLPFDVLPHGDQVVELFVGDVFEQRAPQRPVLGNGAAAYIG